MALPPVSELCPTITVTDQALQIRFPGGASLVVQTPQPNPVDFQLTKQLLAQSSAALSPLQPVFNLLEVALAQFETIKAIPEAITQLDPTKIIETIEDLAAKIDKVLGLIPQLSVPIMIVDIIDAILKLLTGVKDQLQAIVDQLVLIDAAEARAIDLGSQLLQDIADCARAQMTVQTEALGESLSAINSLIEVLNIFMELAGLDPIPSLADLGSDASAALDIIDDIIEILQGIRDLIPV